MTGSTAPTDNFRLLVAVEVARGTVVDGDVVVVDAIDVEDAGIDVDVTGAAVVLGDFVAGTDDFGDNFVVAVGFGATATPPLRTSLPPDLMHVYLLPATRYCFPRVAQGVSAFGDFDAETGNATRSEETITSPRRARFITALYNDFDSSRTASFDDSIQFGNAQKLFPN